VKLGVPSSQYQTNQGLDEDSHLLTACRFIIVINAEDAFRPFNEKMTFQAI
jgi:hypothetical protein